MADTTPPPPPPPQFTMAPMGNGQPPANISGALYSKGLTILLAIVTCGIWTFVWSFRTGEDLKTYNRDGVGGVLALIITFLLSPVMMFLFPYEIEKMYERDGRVSPVSTLWGLWFLLPIIGNIVWYLKVQDALNDFWRSKGSQG